MKPILYRAEETAFTNLGLGVLSECIECFVTEERNGVFECSFKYPVKGRLFKEILPDRWIKCDASYDLTDQRFKIVTISKPMNGIITVYCEHCSYLTAQLMLEPFVEIRDPDVTGIVAPVSAYDALVLWKQAIVDDNPFTIDTNTDIELLKTTTWSIKDVDCARRALGGVAGSILDIWGGEYRFDNYKIGLFTHRGLNRGVVVRYGKNLTDIKQEESIASTYTSVYPFATYTDDNENEQVVTLDSPYYIDSEYAENYESRRILRVDFSSEFQEGTTPTKAALQTLTLSYIEKNNIGVPKVSITASFLDLSKTINYQDYKFLEQVCLCDTVRVYFEDLDIDTTAEVISCKWDVINERMDSVEIGDARASLSDTIKQQQADIKEAKQGSTGIKSYVSTAIQRATQLLTGNAGGHIVIRQDDDGKPIELLIMDTDDMLTAQDVWRYNLNGWGHSSSGINGPYTLAATIDGQIVATLITTGILQGGNFYLNLDTGQLKIGGGTIVERSGQQNQSLASILSDLEEQVNGKITTYYQQGEPSHSILEVGDIWYCSATTGQYAQKTWRWNGSGWEEMSSGVPQEVIDKIDGKAKVFYQATEPTTGMVARDVWIDSDDPTKQMYIYTGTAWVKASDFEIGGRNYLLKSDQGGISSAPAEYIIGRYNISEGNGLVSGEDYTISITFTNTAERKGICPYVGGGAISIAPWKDIPSAGTHTFVWNFTATDDMSSALQRIFVYCSTTGSTQGSAEISGTCIVDRIKLEKGNKATDWTPAPEDFDADIENLDSRIDSTANELTNQAEMTAERIAEDEANITVLQGRIGSLEESEKTINTFISQAEQQMQKIADNAVDEFKRIVSRNLKFDATGLTISAEDSPFKSVWIEESLRFQQGDDVMAWLSNQMLHINMAEIMQSMKLGNYFVNIRKNGGFSIS